MGLLYNIFIVIYHLSVRLAALRNAKAKAWIEGRKHLFIDLAIQLNKQASIIWVHSASTGEFEQAKPVIESLKEAYPQYKILATFFSPSGYNAARNYAHIDYRYYLPLDTAANATRFINIVNPKLVIFSKYDFWHHHIKAVHGAGVPLLLISAAFRPGQVFFKWYGGFYKSLLLRFTHLFVQDAKSLQLLQQHRIHHSSISGDTRFDRVLSIRNNFSEIDAIKKFTATSPVLVAGSTWPGDEALLQQLPTDLKLIIAPHEITDAHIQEIKNAYKQSILFSEAATHKNIAEMPVLVIDNIGMLSRLYQYATITYVGGGFTKDGIHNILEAAVWGKPVIIGPNYKKYREAKELIAAGGAFSVKKATELQQIANTLLSNKAALKAASEASEQYVLQNGGATKRIMAYIQEKRLLTR